jgi:hypothetical protein
MRSDGGNQACQALPDILSAARINALIFATDGIRSGLE